MLIHCAGWWMLLVLAIASLVMSVFLIQGYLTQERYLEYCAELTREKNSLPRLIGAGMLLHYRYRYAIGLIVLLASAVVKVVD